MKWYDLIFSGRPQHRFRRHTFFWITWWFYFGFSFFLTQQGFTDAGSAKWIFAILIKSALLLIIHAFIVYVFIYFLLPFLVKTRYVSFFGGLLFLCSVAIAWSYFCYARIFPLLDSFFQLSTAITKDVLLWDSIIGGLISALKVLTAATIIKLLKSWYIKQKENEKLEKEKISVDLELLKAQIHPDVLFSSLDSIYTYAKNDPPKASELLLKLSDLLSYILYECDQQEVLLEKEIKMLKDYIALEKIRMRGRLEVSISVKGLLTQKMISPLLLLPFVENSFVYCGHQTLEKTWINLDIRVAESELSMKIVNGKSADRQVHTSSSENGLGNVHKRLHLLYPGRSEIRIHAEPEIMMTYLKVKLDIPSAEHSGDQYKGIDKQPFSYGKH